MRELEKIKLFNQSRALTKNKKMLNFDHFPRPVEIDCKMFSFFGDFPDMTIIVILILGIGT